MPEDAASESIGAPGTAESSHRRSSGPLAGLRPRLLLVVLLPWLAAMLYVALFDPRFRDQATQETAADLALAVQLAQAEQDELVSVAREFLIMLAAFADATGLADGPACAKTMAELHPAHPQFQNFGFLDRNGKLLCAALPTPPGASFSGRAFVGEAAARRAFTVSDYQIGPVTALPQIGFALPLADNGMPVSRLLFVTAHLEVFRRLAQRSRLRAGQDLLLVDSAGTVLFAHPARPDLIGQTLPVALRPPAPEAASGTNYVRPGLDGEQRLARHAAIDAAGKTLHLTIGTPLAALEARAWVLQRDELQALGLIGLGALVLTWYAAELLVLAKLRRLRHTVERWTQGNLQARAGFGGTGGEIRMLARDLDAMATALDALMRRHRSILEAAGEGIYGLDMEGRVHFANSAAAQLLGYRSEELQGQKLGALAGPALVAEPREAGDLALSIPSGEVRRHVPVFYRCRNGETLRADLVRTPIYERGAQVGIVDVFSDRRESHRLTQALRDSEERLRAIIEAAPDAIFIVRDGGRITYLNDATCRLLDAPRSDLLESDLERVLPVTKSGTPTLGTLITTAAHCGTAAGIHIETEIERRDGTRLPVEVGLSHFITREGGFVVAVARDITARKLAETALRELNDTLERRVQQRTAAIERAYRDLESFSYSVAHDLRAPLRAINGFTQMVLQSEGERFTAAGRDFFERVVRNARKMDELIEDILRYSRSATGKVQTVPVDMDALAREVVNELHGAARVDIAALPPATGDPAMLRQVWVNLVGNALKFSAVREHPQLEIGCRGLEERVYFVADNGVGFDMSRAERLFGMFQRLHAGEQFPGTGVGLAIVRRLLERQGGQIWAKSEPGKGATFYFTVAGRPDASAWTDGASPLPVAATAPPPWPGESGDTKNRSHETGSSGT